MDDHLAKPVRIADLAAALAKWTQPEAEPMARPAGPEPAIDRLCPAEAIGVDDPEFVAAVLRTFQDSLATDLAALREAGEAGDWAGARRLAHWLKGAAAAVGAGLLASVLAELEASAALGVAGAADWAALESAVAGEVAEVDRAIGEFLARGTAT
ncbi:MAG: Hpt domain-containing protein [Gammaproteobacteria bacterium]|nr:Hpt domain-containing protein [Gammaproteobacteria bacterium]